VGSSGSGKSTLLMILGRLLKPDSGSVQYVQLSEEGRSRPCVSWMFQSGNMLPSRRVLDNVMLGPLVRGRSREVSREAAITALADVGLETRSLSRGYDLSGGEAQRVCLARALATQPQLLLADEPTGQLDRTTSMTVARLIVERAPFTTVLATHDLELARLCPRILELRDGELHELDES